MSKFPKINNSGIEIDFLDDRISIAVQSSFNDVNIYGSRYGSNIVISFDDERYERIYKSLLKQVNEVGYFSGCPDNYSFSRSINSRLNQVVPGEHITPPTDFSKWEKEKLVKFIEDGKTYHKDKRPFFNSNLFDVKYPSNDYAFYDIVDNNLRLGQCQKDIYRGLVSICDKFEEEDFGKVIENNAPLIRSYLKLRNYTHVHSFEVCNFYYTEELIAPHIIIVGAKIK